MLLSACDESHQEEVKADPAAKAMHTADWVTSGGDPEHQRYSALTQINRDNVKQLEVAWTYRTGHNKSKDEKLNAEPLVFDGILYAVSAAMELIAVNAQTGEEIWRFNPYREGENVFLGLNRGHTAWVKGEQRRIVYGASNYLYVVDAHTGKAVETFGDKGRVDLREGLRRDPRKVSVTSPGAPMVFEDLVMVGTATGDAKGSAPGDIRAYNINTGEIEWTFHTIPLPGEFGYDTWPEDYWKTGGASNAWTGLSLDTENGIVYAPTGSPSYDNYGADRHGDNLYGDSLIAIDARTGKRVWHFQTVHHDLWDRDLSSVPTIGTLTRDGKSRKATFLPTKQGHLFVLDSKTGEPLFPIEERPVPAGNIPGEWYSPTQPFPAQIPPFTRQHITEADVTDFTPEIKEEALAMFRSVRHEGPYTPVGEDKPTLIFPSLNGGANWGGASYDPATQMLYINSCEEASPLQVQAIDTSLGSLGKRVYMQNCAVCHGAEKKGNLEVPELVTIAERYSGSDWTMIELVTNGRGRMPGFAHLPQAEVLAVLNFLFDAGDEYDAAEVADESKQTTTSEKNYISTGYNYYRTKDDVPAIKPPWGRLTAYDMTKGEIAWQIPFGEYPELAEKGFKNTGSENYGGAVVTAGGLLFIAATPDEKIRAYDKATGELVWEHALPASAFASTITYMVDGRQYIAVAAGGNRMGRPLGDYYVAFALPEK